MSNQRNRWWRQWLITADEARTRIARSMVTRPSVALSLSQPHLGGLEPRILFSAAPIDLPDVSGAEDSGATVVAVDTESTIESSDFSPTVVTTTESSATEIILIDSSVPDLQMLLDDLSSSDEQREVYVLGADFDGLDQISAILDGHSDVSAVHVISHSEEGAVKLGNVWLGQTNLDGYAGQIAAWQAALATDADLLLYGCDLASNAEGQTLIDSLAALTGANVAASVDDTGHASFGADWDLEYSSGAVDTEVVFSSWLQESWHGKLATITVDTFLDVVDGGDGLTSLREAVIQANVTGGDTIVLGAGTYTLSIAGDEENDALQGDLDIRNDVTITGAGADLTIIDGGGLDRVIEVRTGSGQLQMSDVTIQGGDAGLEDGGGIFIQSSSELTLERVIVRANFASEGGGIFNDGVITLSDVQISSNVATIKGGGLHDHGTADLIRVTIDANQADLGGGIYVDSGAAALNLTNVTVSGNTATSSGGGLYNDSNATIVNSTFTLNTADSAGGIRDQSAMTMILNSIVAGNSADSANPNVQGSFDSQGTNLIASLGSASGFGGTDIIGVSALLNPLADNGGFVETHSLQAGSQAIGSGTNLGATVEDARGFSRRDGWIDIGAFESGAASTSKIYWTDTGTGKIQRADLDGSNVEDLVTGLAGTFPTALYVDISSQKMYWSDQYSGVIRRANLDGSSTEVVLTGLFGPREVTIDATNGKIYWTEDGFGINSVRRANLDGSDIENLVTAGLNDPGGIAVDAAGGKLYWVDTGNGKVQRADLDGSNVEDLVTSLDGPRRLKLDLSAGKMYWTEDGAANKISRADLDGGNVEDLVTGLDAPAGIELDLQAGFLYWTDMSTNKIQRADLDTFTVTDVVTTSLDEPVGLALAGFQSITANQTPTDIGLTATSISENTDTSSGTNVGSLTASDPDVGDTFTFAVVGGADQLRFSIGPGDELILTDGVLDHESQDTYSVLVRVTDSALNSYDELLTIGVDDLNEAPTDITLDNSSVSENVKGDVVGNLAVVDVDDGDSHRWTVDDHRFRVVGGQLELKPGHQLDHELEPTVNVTITVTDQNGSGVSFNKLFTITVDDVDEVPVAIAKSYDMLQDDGPLQTAAPGVLDGAFDPEGNPVTARLLVDAAHGTLALNADGSFSYTPNENFFGTDTFTFEAWDGVDSSAATVVTIEVAPRFIPPIPGPAPATESEQGEEDGQNQQDDPPSEDDSEDQPQATPGAGAKSNPSNTPRVSGDSNAQESLVAVLPGAEQSEPWVAEATVVEPEESTQNSNDESVQVAHSEDESTEGLRVRPSEVYQISAYDAQWQSLDDFREDLLSEDRYETLAVGAAVGVSVAMSVGHAAWALRASYMAASTLLTAMPIWQSIDPLPVLQFLDGEPGAPADNESLQSIIQDSGNPTTNHHC